MVQQSAFKKTCPHLLRYCCRCCTYPPALRGWWPRRTAPAAARAGSQAVRLQGAAHLCRGALRQKQAWQRIGDAANLSGGAPRLQGLDVSAVQGCHGWCRGAGLSAQHLCAPGCGSALHGGGARPPCSSAWCSMTGSSVRVAAQHSEGLASWRSVANLYEPISLVLRAINRVCSATLQRQPLLSTSSHE